MNAARALALFLPVALLVGCDDEPTGSISGTVTFEGRSVDLGTVAVISRAEGVVRQAAITGGSYRLDNVPVSMALFAVHVHAAPPRLTPPGEGGADSSVPEGFVLPIPVRYKDPEQSGLVLDVQAGEQQFNIELAR